MICIFKNKLLTKERPEHRQSHLLQCKQMLHGLTGKVFICMY